MPCADCFGRSAFNKVGNQFWDVQLLRSHCVESEFAEILVTDDSEVLSDSAHCLLVAHRAVALADEFHCVIRDEAVIREFGYPEFRYGRDPEAPLLFKVDSSRA